MSRYERTDPRSDPRIVVALAPFGLDGAASPSPVTSMSPRDLQLRHCARSEVQLQAMLAALTDRGSAPGVMSEITEIRGPNGSAITLYLHWPAQMRGPAPSVVHLHGGTMAMLSAVDPVYVRWRDALAASAIPETHQAAVRDLSSFARSLASAEAS